MTRQTIGIGLALSCVLAIGLCANYNRTHPMASEADAQITELPLEQEPDPTTRHVMGSRSTAYDTLRSSGLTPQTVRAITTALKTQVRLNRLRKGSEFVVSWSLITPELPTKVVFIASASETFTLTPQADNTWTCLKDVTPVTTKLETFAGTVNMNLWESARDARMEGSLINSLAEVFAWQVDFSREVKPGDRWRLTVERRMVGEQTIGWGPILAAEYENNGQLHTAVRFPAEGPHASYYAPDGSSLKQFFLKSPLRLGRITSYFSSGRYHPILKVSRPHNGIDYGASPGTPVMSVGRGTVAEIGFNSEQGNIIKVRHNKTYETAYLHLQKFADGLTTGSTIEQGQVIGYVGSSGLATGPHLHFSFFENGRYTDPLGVKFPAGEPVPAAQLGQFKQLVSSLLRKLPDWKLAFAGPAAKPRPST